MNIRIIAALIMINCSTLVFAQPPKLIPTRNYYIAVAAHSCTPDAIEFRGEANLPAGALITISVNDFHGDGWELYSGWSDVPINQDGSFRGRIEPRQGARFHHNLILIASFDTNPGTARQPDRVLQIVGKHGEYLAGVENPEAHLTELSGLSANPQLQQSSGWHYGLYTIARVPSCGPDAPKSTHRTRTDS